MKPSSKRKALRVASTSCAVIAVASGLLGVNILLSGLPADVAGNAIMGFLVMSALVLCAVCLALSLLLGVWWSKQLRNYMIAMYVLFGIAAAVWVTTDGMSRWPL